MSLAPPAPTRLDQPAQQVSHTTGRQVRCDKYPTLADQYQHRRTLASASSSGSQELRILVRVDTEISTVRIIVTGYLTPINLYGLGRVILRANTLASRARIIIDLTETVQTDQHTIDAALRASAFESRARLTTPRSGIHHRLQVLPAH